MAIIAAIVGAGLVLWVLWEGFETIVLPRRVTRRFRLTRLFYRRTWLPWVRMVRLFVPAQLRETWLSVFGPLSLLLLMIIWVFGLILGFALIHWSLGPALLTREGITAFFSDLYLSGTTFFTLGLGDVVPRGPLARLLVVIESGMGFGFLALVIGYLPALNQSFARREESITLLDARAGSPPTASEMLRRHGAEQGMEALRELLHEWERWSSELLEGHLSYPVLAYFRSQHVNQSWPAALTAILDTCCLVIAGLQGGGRCARQAGLTFAMARHAVVDLCLVFGTAPKEPRPDRLPPQQMVKLRGLLAQSGLKLSKGKAVEQELAELRHLYEPYCNALAAYFQVRIPPWVAAKGWVDNWQMTIWERPTAWKVVRQRRKEEHF
ncbi:MAG: metal transporter [Chloroflexi bacterium RBG_16_50_11]|nr:MAG: metal transporter [Chloroflexi bacterium RBG_16_50_11]